MTSHQSLPLGTGATSCRDYENTHAVSVLKIQTAVDGAVSYRAKASHPEPQRKINPLPSKTQVCNSNARNKIPPIPDQINTSTTQHSKQMSNLSNPPMLECMKVCPGISIAGCCTSREISTGRTLVLLFLWPITSFLFVNTGPPSPDQKMKAGQAAALNA